MTLSDVAIKKPVFAWMLMFALLLFGAISFTRLGVSQNPDVDSPIANISLTWEGAAPEVMENEVLDPVEEALMTVEGIKQIKSTCRFGSAQLTAEFELSKDIDVAIQEIQTRLAQAQRNLPKDMDPPIIRKVNPEDQPVITVGVSGDRPYRDMARYVQDHMLGRFETLPGVGEVSLGGFVEPNLRVWLKREKMRDLQLTVNDVVAAIQNQHSAMPGGVLQGSRQEQNVRVMGEAESVDEFGSIAIPQRLGQGFLWRTIRIRDIADIEEGLADVRRVSRTNGDTSIAMQIKKQRGANAVAVAHAVRERIAQERKILPEGMRTGVNFDTTKFIEDNIHELLLTLVLAVILTALVCWLFLGSWSSTLNVILAIPTALGGTLVVMHVFGFTLNTITMMAISLVIGIVVDDAIVVLENIARHREEGAGLIEAAVHGSREILFSVIVISSAVAAIFLPVAFMKGVIGKFFFQFGVTISVAVGFSLLEAVTLAPMRCSQFLQVGHTTRLGKWVDRRMEDLTAFYRRVLAWALERRWTVLLTAFVLFGASLLVAKMLRSEMMPSQDTGFFVVRYQTPPGSSLAFTDEVFRKVEEWFKDRKEVKRYFGTIGGMDGGVVNSGFIFVTMKDMKERPNAEGKRRKIRQQEFMQLVRKALQKIPGMHRVSLQDRSQQIGAGGGRGYPIELSVRGPDWDKLGGYAEKIRTKLTESGLAVDMDSSFQVGVPEVRIVPDREKAAERAVTVAEIARTINATVGGVRVGKYTKDGRRYDVRVSLADKNRRETTDISRLWVRNVRGELIPLSDVTRITSEPTLLAITREDRERSINVFGNVAPGKSQSEAIAKAHELAKEILPDGYRLATTGNASEFQSSMRELMMALVLGIAIAYMILGAQFNSFIHPITILLALPFSISGALAALWATNQSLNMMSMIGILLLMGIVKKNSILLVEFANAKRHEGLAPKEALLEACPLRLRPILMTSLAIVAGAVPAAMTIGPGAELRTPMGVVVIGGTVLSTLLTLIVVPCAYSLFTALEGKDQAERLARVEAALPSGRAG
ncbi:MAG: efflux RND transporter permease subunit [Elusimicrobia bacterium]|nr:efflux RND transporter permease subunit [Elusimicrobiota bacterium]